MADISKISPDDGSTILNIKDSNAVHWGDQSKGIVFPNLAYNRSETHTESGVTFTNNSDKSINVNGLSSALIINFLNIYTKDDFPFDVDKYYILKGCPSGGDESTYKLDIVGGNGLSFGVHDVGNGIVFKFPRKPVDTEVYQLRIRIASGVTIDNKVFKPMLYPIELQDMDYSVGAPNNLELGGRLNSYMPLNLTPEYLTAKRVSNVDLNDFTMPIILNFSSGDASTINNKPSSVTASAEVIVMSTWGGYTRQFIMERDTNAIYTRVKNSGGWTTWSQITMS